MAEKFLSEGNAQVESLMKNEAAMALDMTPFLLWMAMKKLLENWAMR